ncbi:MAG: hypothetical protein P4L40_17240 [Terracidiphilus sp.]|nr:hypothetical protein [Terracidiphilus sp.]
MPLNFASYRFTDGQTPLSAGTFNPRFQDVDTRIANLETLKVSWETAIQAVSDFGLERIDAILGSTLASLGDNETSAAATVANINAQYQAAVAAVQALQSWIAASQTALSKGTVGNSLLAGDGNGGLANVTLGPGLSFANNILSGTPPIAWSRQTASFAAAIGAGYYVPVAGVNATMPRGVVDGQSVAFISGLPAGNTFTITPAAGQTIMGSSGALTVDEAYAAMSLVFFAAVSDWRVF